jgi:hypothetical protein
MYPGETAARRNTPSRSRSRGPAPARNRGGRDRGRTPAADRDWLGIIVRGLVMIPICLAGAGLGALACMLLIALIG